MACEPRCPSPTSTSYCDRCDLLVGPAPLHVTDVERRDDGVLVVTVESPRGLMGCPTCGVVAVSKGRRTVKLVDAPAFGSSSKECLSTTFN
jgi:hypothetical protein